MKNITLKKKMTEIIEMCPNKSMEEMMIMIRTLTIQECKRKFKAKPETQWGGEDGREPYHTAYIEYGNLDTDTCEFEAKIEI